MKLDRVSYWVLAALAVSGCQRDEPAGLDRATPNLSSDASSAVTRPLTARVSGNAHLTATDDPCVIRNEETGGGTATHLGEFTWRDVESVDFCAIPGGVAVVGSFVMAAADGDELRGTLATTGTFQPNGDLVIQGTYSVTGGTGRFANATGSGNVDVVAQMAPGLPFTGSLDGSITF